MAFTTQIFIFIFFPLCMGVYYLALLLQKNGPLSGFLTKIRATDLVLIALGCVFYLWACFNDLFCLIVYVLAVYLLGRLIERLCRSGWGFALMKKTTGETKGVVSAALIVFALAVAAVLYALVRFKYTGMLVNAWNFLFREDLQAKGLIAPLGISFITFSAISYLADIYKGKAPAGNLIDCALYLTFFPKVVSGPIVLWRDFSGQISARRHSLPLVSEGISRIMIGFAKKLILADSFGACLASIGGNADVPAALGGSLLYMLQIYYDFSGYSDIAIGLSNMLGFSVKENFNFPYLSCSISEFWRRWHISLGTWFREYVYFPLGGSRKGLGRTLLNLGVVFVLTGIWHGAGWTYMLWGVITGLWVIAEKLIARRTVSEKTPRWIKWFIAMVFMYLSLVIFRFDHLSDCVNWFRMMFGWKDVGALAYNWRYYFDAQMITLMVIGILGATVFGLPKVQAAYQRFTATKAGYAVRQITFLLLFLCAILFMVNAQYSPFIYFQY